MKMQNSKSLALVVILPVMAVMLMAGTRVHLRVEAIQVGYELGHLKDQEARLLEEQSRLKMQLAKLTTRKHLTLMADEETGRSKAGRTLAARR